MRGTRDSILWRLMEGSPWQWGGMLIALAALVALVVWLQRWLRQDPANEDHTNDLLTQFGDLHRQGELTDEEYRRVRSKLIGGKSDGTNHANADSEPPGKTQTEADPG